MSGRSPLQQLLDGYQVDPEAVLFGSCHFLMCAPGEAKSYHMADKPLRFVLVVAPQCSLEIVDDISPNALRLFDLD